MKIKKNTLKNLSKIEQFSLMARYNFIPTPTSLKIIFMFFWLGEAQPGAVLPEDSDSDDGIADGVGHFGSGQNVPEMSDFDMMMELQKAQRKRRKKKVRNLKSQKILL